MIEVFDNFLSVVDFSNIVMTTRNIPWYQNYVMDPNKFTEHPFLCEEQYNYQLAHVLYYRYQPNTEYFQLLNPILNKLKVKAVVSAKLNYNPTVGNVFEHCYHTDNNFGCTTAIYYVNSNDGYTSFETGEKIESVANRLLTFPSELRHTGTTCTTAGGRIVLNLNYWA